MAQRDLPDQQGFAGARDALAAAFDVWAARRGRQVRIAAIRQAIRFKWECGGDLHHWAVDDFPRLFGDWLPQHAGADRTTLATLGPTMLSFVDFLGDTGRLAPTVPGWWDVRAMVTGLTVWLVDALTECGQCGVMADRLHERNANIGDPTVQERLLAVMARHLVEHFPPPPVEPSLLSWMEPERVAFRTTRWMQPPVHRPSMLALSRAAAAAPALRRLQNVTRWAANRPRRLTARGNLTISDGIDLAGWLDVGERDLARHSGRTLGSSTLLTETHFAFRWASATGLLRVRGSRLLCTPLGSVLVERPAELALRALASLCALGMDSAARDAAGPAHAQTPHELLRALVEALYCATRPLDFGPFIDQAGGLPAPLGASSVGARSGQDGLRRLVRQLVDLGVVNHSGGTVLWAPDGSTQCDGGRLCLTPLGTWCVNRLLRAEGLPTPVFGELADFDATTLLEMCAGYDDGAAAEEARLWAASRRDSAVTELAEAIRTVHPSARMSAFAALSGLGRGAEPAVRSLLDEPRIRPFALIWLIDRGLESHYAMRQEDVTHMLVEAMVPYLHDDPTRAVYMFTRGRSIEDQITDITRVWRLDNPYAVPLLEAIAARHPHDDVAHAARVALRTR